MSSFSRNLFLGPMPKPNTGQANCFEFLVKDLTSDSSFIVNTQKFRRFKVISTLYSIIRTLIIILFHKIDLIYISGSRSIKGSLKEFPIYLFKSLFHYRIIYHLHGYELSSSNHSPLTTFWFKIIYQRVDELITLSNENIPQFFETSVVHIVPNFYHPIYEINVDIRINKKVIFLSNIIHSKGVEFFLDLAENCILRNCPYTFELIGNFMGDGFKSRSKIKRDVLQKIKSLNSLSPGKVILNQNFNKHQILDSLRTSDIMILPTFYASEAMPLSILEAMRLGNAIITTDHNFLPAFLSNRNGRIIEKKSLDALIFGFDELINSSTTLLKIRRNNIQYAKQFFSPESHIDSIREIIFL